MSRSETGKREIRQRMLKAMASVEGVISLEFALILPVMLLISIPTVNTFYNIRAEQKVHKATSAMADAVSLSLPVVTETKEAEVTGNSSYLTSERLGNMAATIDDMLLPIKLTDGKGTLIISSVYKPVGVGKPPVVAWQYYYSSYGIGFAVPKDAPASIIGKTGENATLPQKFIDGMYDDEGLIVTELTYNFIPPVTLFQNTSLPTLQPSTIFSVNYYPARYGALHYIVPDYSPPSWPPLP